MRPQLAQKDAHDGTVIELPMSTVIWMRSRLREKPSAFIR
jgi:hypothetical protein